MSTHHGILLHVVFSTKWRKPLISETWQDDLFAYIAAAAREHQAISLCAGGTQDHIHLLLKTHPKFAIASTIQLIKANSSRWINQERKTNGKFSWQRGYGAFSVSESMVDTVKSYIANQREHHRLRSFREEYLAILRRHKIEFDER
ncbi:MAG: IS200/IS605 family transposase [Planctomycetales bacterium]|nr:IS200/IS605 family transposase [Planctomycetales bacterium]